jgi:putative Mg2+ transporter-C (MgtC) family protein
MEGVPLVENWDRLSVLLAPFVVRCGTAALCGALVGLERERRAKPAGFRTNSLICLGAAMYMAVGLLLAEEDGHLVTDPARIAAQVVTGVGFLGAGCIIEQRGRITGLTTAATIWVVAAIGIVAGAGYPILAVLSTAAVALTLTGLGMLERRFLNVAKDEGDRQ